MPRVPGAVLLLAAIAVGCSSPAKIEVRPDPLVLTGKGATGQLEAVVFDDSGKEMTDKFDVTWMCLDTKTVKVHQDGRAEALSSGRTLVDVEIVGTEVHGAGTIEVQIPAWVETSVQELPLVAGSDPVRIWAETRDDKGFPVKGAVPEWKVEDPEIVSLEKIPGTGEVRTIAALKPMTTGETFLTASSGDLAQDIRVVVVSPEVAAEALAAQAAAEEKQ